VIVICVLININNMTPENLVNQLAKWRLQFKKNGLASGKFRMVSLMQRSTESSPTFGGWRHIHQGEKSESFQYYDLNPSQPYASNDNVSSIYKDRTGTLWIGSFGQGLCRKQDEQFRCYQEQDGLPSDFVPGVSEDDHGILWISTAKGLPRTGSWNRFDAQDGLPATAFNERVFYRGANGAIFFCGSQGFVSFHPDDIKSNRYVAPVIITALRRYNSGRTIDVEGVAEKDDLKLSYQDKILTFEFAALSYDNPAENQHAYELGGFNKNWIQLGNKHEATFTNLSPGTTQLSHDLKISVVWSFWPEIQQGVGCYLRIALYVALQEIGEWSASSTLTAKTSFMDCITRSMARARVCIRHTGT
jgi:hypothetical protein